MSNVFIVDHPLIQHNLMIIRDKDTGSKDFRQLLDEISMLMWYEVTRNITTACVEVTKTVCRAKSRVLATDKIAVIPILRAGLGMSDGLMRLLSFAKIGHIGLYRNPDTLEPMEYYCKHPAEVTESIIILVDTRCLPPVAAHLRSSGSLRTGDATNIRLMCLIAAPEGIDVVLCNHPDKDIYVAAVDEALNDHAYIVPGLGDAGDHLFGTK